MKTFLILWIMIYLLPSKVDIIVDPYWKNMGLNYLEDEVRFSD